MRKSFDALTALVVQQLGRDVMSGDMFLFVNRMRRRAKVLFWGAPGETWSRGKEKLMDN